MNKKLNRVLAVFLAILMLVSASPVSLLASAEIDLDSADYLTFIVTNGGTVSVGTSVELYSQSTVVKSATTNEIGVAEFIQLSDSELQSITKAVVGDKVLEGPFEVKNYYVDFGSAVDYADPNLTVSASSFNLKYGDEVSLDASVDNDAEIVFSSSDTSVATVDDNGNVKAVGVGVATIDVYVGITGNYSDASKTVTVAVSASDNAITAFELGSIPYAEIGDSFANPALIAADAKGTVTYESSDESFATVDAQGNVTVQKSNGSAVITATFTPDADCTTYAVDTATYEISASFALDYNFNGWTNAGLIEVVGHKDDVTFTIDDQQKKYVADDGIIDIGISQIPDGEHKISIYTNGELAGEITVKKDTVAPTFEINDSNSDKWVKTVDISIEDFADDRSGPKSVEYTYGEKNDLTSEDITSVKIDDSKIPEGINTITVTVTDAAGNSTSEEITVKKDTHADEVELDYSGAWFNNKDFDINLTVKKGDSEKKNTAPVKSVKYKLADGDEKDFAANDDDEYAFTLDVNNLNLAEGANEFTVIVTDEADNKTTIDNVTLNYDVTAPTFDVTYENAGQWITAADNKSIIIENISDNASDIAAVEYYCNDISANRNDVTDNKIDVASLVNSLIDGKCVVTVLVTDIAGNVATKTVEVLIDDTAPEVTGFKFEEKADDSVADVANKLTYGQFFKHGIKVTVDVKDLESGIEKEDLILNATDKNSGETKEISAMSYDNEKAVFFIDESVFGTGEDSENQPVFVGTVSLNVKNRAGIELNVDATSENSDSLVTITWETVLPDVTISMPEADYIDENNNNAEWYASVDAKIDFADAHSGVSAVNVDVNGTPIDGDNAKIVNSILESGTVNVKFLGVSEDANNKDMIDVNIVDADGNVILSEAVNVPADNKYVITAQVVDAAGNASVASVVFYAATNVFERFEKENPVILINLPEDDAYGVRRYDAEDGKIWYSGDIAFNLVILENSEYNSGIKSVNVSVNGTELAHEDWSNIDPSIDVRNFIINTADCMRRADDSYLIEVNVEDNAGNVYTASSVIYIDTYAPKFISGGITVNAINNNNNSAANILNKLTFGLFYNNNVNVVVTGQDSTETTAGREYCSGVKEYVLYIDDVVFATNSTGVFTISAADFSSGELSAKIVDNVYNESEVKKPSDFAGDTDKLVIEKDAPVVSISIPTADFENDAKETVYRYEADGKVWFSGDVDFTVNVSDSNSGLKSVKLKLNNKIVMNTNTTESTDDNTTNYDFTKETHSANFVIGTDSVVDGVPVPPSDEGDGSYTLEVICTDNAGNVTTKTSTVYIDTKAPVVESINFKGKDVDGKDFDKDVSDDNKDGYIITCKADTTITVLIKDPSASAGMDISQTDACGIKLLFTPTDSKIQPFAPAINDVTIEDCETENKAEKDYSKSYLVTYTLAKSFEGTFSVTMVDNLKNERVENTIPEFILEDSAMHDAEKDHITMELEGYYAGCYFNEYVYPVIKVKDINAGIRNVSVEMFAANESYIPNSYYRDVAFNVNGMTATNLGGWTKISSKKNYTTEASLQIPVETERDDIVIKVNMTDNAGNTSSAEYSFNTDFTAPVVSCSLSSDATPVNRYYSSAVTASFTVNEHNFDENLVVLTEGNIPGWPKNDNPDIHTTSVTYASEGAHQFTMQVTDKAGNVTTCNASEGTFYVDNSDPSIKVTGMAYEQASNSDDVSFTITASDALCLASEPLTTAFTVWYKEVVDGVEKLVKNDFTLGQLEEMKFISVEPVAGSTEYSYKVNLTNAQDGFNDGIYSFSCSVTDMSGRTSNAIICDTQDNASSSVSDFMFSLNRKGSTYMIYWMDAAGNMTEMDPDNEPATNKPTDYIAIREINPTEVMADAVGTKITIYDGIESKTVTVDAEKDANEKYSVYTYKIPRDEYFKNDGVYELRMESVDAAGNVSDGDSKNFIAADFTIDTTVPVIKSDLEDGIIVEAETHRFSISVEDLTSCVVDITDENNNYLSVYLEDTADATPVEAKGLKLDSTTKNVYIDVAGSRDVIRITATDALGQSETVEYRSITVSTSGIVIFFANLNNMPWIYAIIIGVPVVIAAIIIIIAKKRKGDDFKDTAKKGKKK